MAKITGMEGSRPYNGTFKVKSPEDDDATKVLSGRLTVAQKVLIAAFRKAKTPKGKKVMGLPKGKRKPINKKQKVGSSQESTDVSTEVTSQQVEWHETYDELLGELSERLLYQYHNYVPSNNGEFSNFKIMYHLGRGSFGLVVSVKYKTAGGLMAMKIQSKKKIISRKQLAHVCSEKRILACTDFEFLVKLLFSFKDNANVYLVLEFLPGGDFFGLVRKKRRFDEAITRFFAAQVLLSFEYLHSADIIYRDLKPENLLVDHDGYIKVTDYGFAKYVPTRTFTLCGTPEYFSPELLKSQPHGKGVDWWCFGMLIYEMFYGRTAYAHREERIMFHKIQDSPIPFPNMSPPISDALRSLISHLLEKDVTHRFGCLAGGVGDIRNHDYFSGLDWFALYQRKLPAPFPPKIEVGIKGKSVGKTDIEISDVLLFEKEFENF